MLLALLLVIVSYMKLIGTWASVANRTAQKYGFTREHQDEFAANSFKRLQARTPGLPTTDRSPLRSNGINSLCIGGGEAMAMTIQLC